MDTKQASGLRTFPLSESFRARLEADQATKKKLRQDVETWTVNGGNYDNAFFTEASDQFPNFSSHENFDLVGEEVVYADLVRQKIQEHEQSGDSRPVVALDIGGMYAASWCRLALHFGQEIEQKKVRFIVSNINLDADGVVQSYEKALRMEPTGYTERMKQSFLKGKDLIEWLQADSSELWQSLRGQIDLAHEEMSLFHSSTPDVDFPLVANLLNSKGIFISKEADLSRSGNTYTQDNLDTAQKAYDTATNTLDHTYNRILATKTHARIWSPDPKADRYFRGPDEYPSFLPFRSNSNSNRE